MAEGLSMPTDDASTLLARTPLFTGLDSAGLQRLTARARERTYRRGEIVFHENDPGGSFFVVVRGLVKVFVTSPGGDEMVLVTLGPSDTFGELALIDGGPRSASAEALDATTLLALTRDALLDVLGSYPALVEGLLRSLGGLVRRLTDQAADLVFLDLHGRVAKLLLGLAEGRGELVGGHTVLDLHLTQTDIAGMVGGSRQSVNQILRSFELLGYLETEGRRLVVKRPDLLRRQARMLSVSEH